MAGKTQTLLDHVLFALKHEGVNLQVLAQALPKVPAHDLVVGIHAAPTGSYVRVACFLWEFFNGTELQGLPVIKATLQSFSKPARQAWDVTWLGDDEFDFRFKSDASVCRYWDATACVAFGLDMAQQALNIDLKDEAEFLAQFDRIFKAVDERFDVRGNDLTNLVLECLQNNGKVSANRRKKFVDTVPVFVFDAIEAEWQSLLRS